MNRSRQTHESITYVHRAHLMIEKLFICVGCMMFDISYVTQNKLLLSLAVV